MAVASNLVSRKRMTSRKPGEIKKKLLHYLKNVALFKLALFIVIRTTFKTVIYKMGMLVETVISIAFAII